MPFLPIVNHRGHGWEPQPRVRLYVSYAKTIVLSLTRPVLNSLKWNHGDRMLVSFGIGTDFGELRVDRVRGKAGIKLCTTNSANVFTIGATIPRTLGDMTRETIAEALPKSAVCDFSVRNGQLFLTVPGVKHAKRPRIEAVS